MNTLHNSVQGIRQSFCASTLQNDLSVKLQAHCLLVISPPALKVEIIIKNSLNWNGQGELLFIFLFCDLGM